MRWVETKKALGGGGDKQAGLVPSQRAKNDPNYTPEYRRNQALVPHNPEAEQKLPDQLKRPYKWRIRTYRKLVSKEHTLVVVGCLV